MVIGDVDLPNDVRHVLNKGPKFSHEPRIEAHEFLALNRRIAGKALEENRERCLLDGVDTLIRSTTSTNTLTSKDSMGKVVSYFRKNRLRLLQADKDGGFVVLTEEEIQKRAGEAIAKNFIPLKASATRVRGKAAAMCKELDLSTLANDIGNSKSNALSMFFTAKTHKLSVPFRTAVSENGTWLIVLSKFLQKHLASLKVQDPYATKSSKDVVRFLEGCTSNGYVFSVDVEDLFYSVPHDALFRSVRDAMESNGAVEFQNSSGVSIYNFMKMLEFYLDVTLISFENKFYRQRQGICIGSCVAPVLTNIFLTCIDSALEPILTWCLSCVVLPTCERLRWRCSFLNQVCTI
ncbi:uncharacterized protein [Dermacentor andersoni]|uniref:uncharacterized protein n=1 Tax=Dermacentor andersoni TaxID=34620 RepID=UPI003B3A7AE5